MKKTAIHGRQAQAKDLPEETKPTESSTIRVVLCQGLGWRKLHRSCKKWKQEMFHMSHQLVPRNDFETHPDVALFFAFSIHWLRRIGDFFCHSPDASLHVSYFFEWSEFHAKNDARFERGRCAQAGILPYSISRLRIGGISQSLRVGSFLSKIWWAQRFRIHFNDAWTISWSFSRDRFFLLGLGDLPPGQWTVIPCLWLGLFM